MAPFRVVILLAILSVLAVGLYDFLQNFEKNACEMTYMYATPQYLKIELDKEVQEKFPKYGLYFYGEGQYADKTIKSGFRMSGIPVLFIPGNAGSYRQVRSLGSVALRKAEDSKSAFHFNYFSLDFNEELSALYGKFLYDETEFAFECIKKILTMYKGATSPPKSVVLVGHSMGGMVARAVMTLPGFKRALVNTIITQSTPHQAPVVAMDPNIHRFYTDVNAFWRAKVNTTVADVTVFSSGGGFRDILVRSALTSVNGIVRGNKSLSSNTMSVPRAWVSTDHLCHVWCKQIVLTTVRAMFDMVDKSTKQIAVSPFYRWSAYLHHFHKNPGPKSFKGAYDKKVELEKNIKWEIRKKLSWKFWKSSIPSTRYSTTAIPPSMVPAEYATPEWGYVAISNILNEKWLGTCSVRPKVDPSKQQKKPEKMPKEDQQCTQLDNQAPWANLLPPLYSDKKVVHLDHEVLKDTTHIVSVLPKTKKSIEIYSELYKLEERHLEYNTTGVVDFFRNFPRSLMQLDVVVNATAPGALFYNVTLNYLEIPLQAYKAHLHTVKCTETPPSASSGAVMKLHVPWSYDHTYTNVPSGKNGSLSLKLMTPKPSTLAPPAQLHLYLLPTCTYTVSISMSWAELFGQFVRFYGPYIPAFAVIQILMVLSWQLKMLDEQGHAPSFGAAHARWAQPYRVVPVSLLLRFMLFYPKEDNIAIKFGIPRDDRGALEAAGTWYAALPIMLYLSMYALIGLYGPFVHALLSFSGKVIGTIFRFLLNPSVQKALARGQYLLFIVAAALAAFVCGTLGILTVYFLTVLKTIGLSMTARSQQRQAEGAWTRYHIHISLVLLLLVSLLLNALSLMVWATNVKYSPVLVDDPSRTLGVVISVTAFILSFIGFPSNPGEMYGIAAALVYITCVLLVMYAMTSVYLLNMFLSAVLIIVTSCVVSSLWIDRSKVPDVREGEREEEEAKKTN